MDRNSDSRRRRASPGHKTVNIHRRLMTLCAGYGENMATLNGRSSLKNLAVGNEHGISGTHGFMVGNELHP